MIVTRAKYDRLLIILKSERACFIKLLNDWNELVEKVNAIGGKSALSRKPNESQFSDAEINSLIQLCHPDKHGNSDRANAITAKLLSMKQKQRI